MIPGNFRPIESWMIPGVTVRLSGERVGVLTSFHTSTMTVGLLTNTYVHSVMIRPKGCKEAFPYGAWAMNQLK